MSEVKDLTEDERDEYEERAAIVQESTKCSREKAEAAALARVLEKRRKKR